MTAIAWATRAAPAKSRDEFRTEFAGLTRADVAVALLLAETPDEVAAAAHLSLALFDVDGCTVPFTEHGTSWLPLNELVGQVRTSVCGPTPHQRRTAALLDAYSDQGRRQRSAERRERIKAKAQLIEVPYRPLPPVTPR